MKIIVAPNSFKGSLDAFQVAKAIEQGLLDSKLDASCTLLPIADGGDHTLDVFLAWRGGTLKSKLVHGPLGNKVKANWAMIDEGKTAVIEMAKASGIGLLDESELDPLKASTFGTGELIYEAFELGADKIILGLGGSATIDGGLGILQALGAKLYDKKGNQIGYGSNPLPALASLSMENVHPRAMEVEFLVLCDVENPLLGPNGAAHVFGPQKGAGPTEVKLLDRSLALFNKLVIKETGLDLAEMKGAGAAGGIAVALKGFFNASVINGVDFLLERMNFEEKIKSADLLITAEGRVDHQTMQGKGPYGVAQKATEYGVPTIILAGKASDIEALNEGFVSVFSITNGPMSLSEAISNTAFDLEATAKQIGNLLSLHQK